VNPAGLPLDGNASVLRQGEALLELLSDSDYAEGLAGAASVGAQYRHVLEHYQAFLLGLGSGRIDYDARAREARLERSREAALAVTRECLAGLEALRGAAERPLEVQMETAIAGGPPDWRASSAGRELQFLLSHTLHHYALIRLLLPAVTLRLGADFGVAPSTLSHRRKGER
jgi:hypothetical protein